MTNNRIPRLSIAVTRPQERAQMFSFLHSDVFLKISGALLGVALAVKALTPEYTIAHKIADGIISAGAALGVYSSTGREVKAVVK